VSTQTLRVLRRRPAAGGLSAGQATVPSAVPDPHATLSSPPRHAPRTTTLAVGAGSRLEAGWKPAGSRLDDRNWPTSPS